MLFSSTILNWFTWIVFQPPQDPVAIVFSAPSKSYPPNKQKNVPKPFFSVSKIVYRPTKPLQNPHKIHTKLYKNHTNSTKSSQHLPKSPSGHRSLTSRRRTMASSRCPAFPRIGPTLLPWSRTPERESGTGEVFGSLSLFYLIFFSW